MVWIDRAVNRDRWRTLVNAGNGTSRAVKYGEFLDLLRISFSSRTLLHGFLILVLSCKVRLTSLYCALFHGV